MKDLYETYVYKEGKSLIKRVRRFAILPVRLTCNDWLWLERYNQLYIKLPNGWTKFKKNRFI